MIHFMWPFAFLLLPLPFFYRRWLKPVTPQLQGALKVPFFNQYVVGSARSSHRAPTHLWRLLLAYLIWGLLVLALARPTILGPQVELPTKGRDLMMAIDLSGSMQQQDLTLSGRPATRLAVVKQTATDFIQRRTGDKVGLVLFSDRAYLQAPLTFDREVVEQLLAQAQVGLTGQKTAIGDAIAIALKRLKEQPQDSRVLILLSDGANNAGVMLPLQAAKLAQQLGIRIYSIGVGARELMVNTGFGQQRINPSQDLDESSLREVAEITGGQYFRATDSQGLAQIYQAIDALEPVSAEAVFMQPQIAMFQWPVAAALILALFLAFSLLPSFTSFSDKKETH